MENILFWGRHIDLKYLRGRANSTFREGSDEVQFGVGRKVGPGRGTEPPREKIRMEQKEGGNWCAPRRAQKKKEGEEE